MPFCPNNFGARISALNGRFALCGIVTEQPHIIPIPSPNAFGEVYRRKRDAKLISNPHAYPVFLSVDRGRM
jgi:hypothetical protein